MRKGPTKTSLGRTKRKISKNLTMKLIGDYFNNLKTTHFATPI
jgi:hypothetical protein